MQNLGGHLLPILFVGIFLAIVIHFIFRMVKYGGLAAAMFGAPIRQRLGEVTGSGKKMMSFVLRVDLLDSDSPDKAVGLELAATSAGSYQMMPITLSRDETEKLIGLLKTAADSW